MTFIDHALEKTKDPERAAHLAFEALRDMNHSRSLSFPEERAFEYAVSAIDQMCADPVAPWDD